MYYQAVLTWPNVKVGPGQKAENGGTGSAVKARQTLHEAVKSAHNPG